jgi:hypothetical protein
MQITSAQQVTSALTALSGWVPPWVSQNSGSAAMSPVCGSLPTPVPDSSSFHAIYAFFQGTQFVVALFFILIGEVGVNVVPANGT